MTVIYALPPRLLGAVVYIAPKDQTEIFAGFPYWKAICRGLFMVNTDSSYCLDGVFRDLRHENHSKLRQCLTKIST